MNGKIAKRLRNKAKILWNSSEDKTKQHITERRVYQILKKEYRKAQKNVK